MSALPPKADMFIVEIDVCFVPIADIRDKGRQRLSGGSRLLAVLHKMANDWLATRLVFPCDVLE
jgi:hypothetical protein